MNAPALAVRRATEEDLSYVESLLERCDLPHHDVRTAPAAFLVGVVDGERVATGGVERAGDAGLLRSVAVEDGVRGQGYGSAMCDELEALAAVEGLGTLYLLTTTAADFFAARGYERVDRDDAPPGVRGTAEFAEVCPDSAACLRLALDDCAGAPGR